MWYFSNWRYHSCMQWPANNNMKNFIGLPRLLLREAEASPSYMNHFLHMGSTFSFNTAWKRYLSYPAIFSSDSSLGVASGKAWIIKSLHCRIRTFQNYIFFCFYDDSMLQQSAAVRLHIIIYVPLISHKLHEMSGNFFAYCPLSIES